MLRNCTISSVLTPRYLTQCREDFLLKCSLVGHFDFLEPRSEVFLVLGDDGSFSIRPVEVAQGQQLDQALALVGATDQQSRSEPRITFARAAGLPDNSPAVSVIGAYRDRGDGDIADLLVSVKDQLVDGAVIARPVPSTEIREILDLL